MTSVTESDVSGHSSSCLIIKNRRDPMNFVNTLLNDNDKIKLLRSNRSKSSKDKYPLKQQAMKREPEEDTPPLMIESSVFPVFLSRTGIQITTRNSYNLGLEIGKTQ